jgi:hypothetical protein
MTMRLIERYESDGTRVEAGFFDDAPRPEAPTISPEAPRLTIVDHAIVAAAAAAMIVGVVVIVAMFAELGQ